MKRSCLSACAVLFAIAAFAQENPMLMRMGGREISRAEFEYVYRCHADGLSPEAYAQLWAQSLRKAEAAKALGLDTTLAFRRQQAAARAALAEAHWMDRQAIDSCARVLYRQMKSARLGRQVQVVQVFKYLPQSTGVRQLEAQRARMDSIYQAIRNHPEVEFGYWVDRYSDHKQLRWVGHLQTTVEFEEVAFALSEGEISKPFFTPAGIHILKVVARKEMPAYEEVADELKRRVRNREKPDNVTRHIVERLKKDWQYRPNREGIEELLTKGETGKPLFTINGQDYTGELFRLFAASHPQAVKSQLEGFIAKSLLDYEGQHTDAKHPEICYALRKSDEDYLVRELTRRKVDHPAMNDRAGLSTYFKFHRSDYRWKTPRYKGAVFHCADKETANQAKKLLKKLPQTEWADKLEKTFNASGAERIKMEQGVFALGDNKYIDKLVFRKGEAAPVTSYPFTVAVGKKQKMPDDYREVIDQVRKDYRAYLDACWRRELEQFGKVEIDQEVLKTVNNN